MAIGKILKVRLVASAGDYREVFDRLLALGIFEPEEQGTRTFPPRPSQLSPPSLALSLERVAYALKVFEKKIPRDKMQFTGDRIRQLETDQTLERFFSGLQFLDSSMNRVRDHLKRYRQYVAELSMWTAFNVSLADIRELKFFRIEIAALPITLRQSFENVSGDSGHLVSFLAEDAKKAYYLVVAKKTAGNETDEFLEKQGASRIHIPDLHKTPSEMLRQIKTALFYYENKLKTYEGLKEKLSAELPAVLLLADHYSNEKKIQGIYEKSESSGRFIISHGWILEKNINQAREALAGLAYIAAENPEEKDNPPVVLENKPLIEPFETVTELYGLPKKGFADPTSALSLFFIIFFGLCLTDAGYGIMLFLITACILKTRRLEPGTRKFFKLLLYGGISTVLMGAMTGGWFGVTVKFKLFDPLKDLMVFFGIALLLGVVHLIAGLGLKARQTAVTAGFKEAFIDQGFWIVLLCSLPALALIKLSSHLVFIPKLLALFSVAGIILFHGRASDKNIFSAGGAYEPLWWILLSAIAVFFTFGLAFKWTAAGLIFTGILIFGRKHIPQIFARLGLGLYSLYGASSFLGDILSYSRLVALGLATGIIGLVVNKMALIARDTPYAGVVLMILIMVFGHIFNLGINILGAFVHSMRLIYVEFFNKFYESGGRVFHPVAREFRFTRI